MTVYLVGCKRSRRVKIGCTSGDPAARLADLQIGSPYPLRLLWVSSPEHGIATELKLHRLFTGYRTHGEWFDFGRANPVNLISAAVDLPTMRSNRPTAVPTRREVVATVPLDYLLADLNEVLDDRPLPAARVPPLLLQRFPDNVAYQRMTGKSLVAALLLLGVKVPRTQNRWPVRPSAIRAAIDGTRRVG